MIYKMMKLVKALFIFLVFIFSISSKNITAQEILIRDKMPNLAMAFDELEKKKNMLNSKDIYAALKVNKSDKELLIMIAPFEKALFHLKKGINEKEKMVMDGSKIEMDTPLPFLSSIRLLSGLLLLESKYYLNTGKQDKAIENIFIVRKFGDVLAEAEDKLMILLVLKMATRNLANRSLNDFINTISDKKQLLKILDNLGNQKRFSIKEYFLAESDSMAKFSIRNTKKVIEQNKIDIDEDAKKELLKKHEINVEMSKAVRRRAKRYLPQIEAIDSSNDYKEIKKTYDKILSDLELTLGKKIKVTYEFIKTRGSSEVTCDLISTLHFSMIMPPFKRIHTSIFANNTYDNLLRIKILLKIYKSANGKYPSSLKELRKSTDREIPKDFFSGKDFKYKLVSKDKYLLWSIGPDMKNDSAEKEYNYKNETGDIFFRENK